MKTMKEKAERGRVINQKKNNERQGDNGGVAKSRRNALAN